MSKMGFQANGKVTKLKVKMPKALLNCTLVFRHFRFSLGSCLNRLLVKLKLSHPGKSCALLSLQLPIV